MVKRDPAWNEERSVSAANDQLRAMLTANVEQMVGDDAELLAKCVPQYPPAGKRMLVDNGHWFRALKRDNVELVTDPIARINRSGVETRSGRQVDADVLIYGTGFYASRLLFPMQLYGKDGVELRERWGAEPARLSRHRDARLSKPVLLLRAEYQHRRERQHHLLLGVRSALHHGLPEAPDRARLSSHGLPRGSTRHLQREDRRRQPEHGLGLAERTQLVQERAWPRHPELAFHAARVLEPNEIAEPGGLHVRLTATPRQRFCAVLLGIAALGVQADPAWRTEVDAAIAAACAVRGLAAHEPLNVRPMADFQGGYTAGVGNVEWEDDHAEQWRSGWCALGVYCAKKRPTGNAASKNPMQGPAGLFDVEQNVLYVRAVASPDALDTVAHETTHALQFQNFPQLRSAHLWYNRDLAAAANAAIEGDAHIVGWFFNQAERLYTCSMAPGHATSNRVRRRGWHPHSLWAHEGFPHVFGPELALERWLAGGTRIDDWLREPPLATLDVLRPERTPEVDFIRLADDLLAAKLTDGDCAAGLANTAGALGIWGLLAQHGNADAEQFPTFIEHWRGDRFRHIACAGEADDELAWVSRWRSAEAAHEFATRYRAIAASVLAHGAVLSAAPTPFVYDTTVVAATPGLHEAAPRLAAAPVRTFSPLRRLGRRRLFPAGRMPCRTRSSQQPRANIFAHRQQSARHGVPRGQPDSTSGWRASATPEQPLPYRQPNSMPHWQPPASWPSSAP